jgi:hypothetical protein
MEKEAKLTLLKVFVSSTKEDLKEERKAARDAILDLFTNLDLLFKPVMFEYEFGSHPSSPKQTSLEYVRDSDIFIGIFNERYGSLFPKEGVSITEREYMEAKKFGKYTLIYVKEIEENKREEKLREFLKKIGDIEKGSTLSKFNNQYELKEKIKNDLLKYYQRFGLKKVRVVSIESNIPASIFSDGKYVGDID